MVAPWRRLFLLSIVTIERWCCALWLPSLLHFLWKNFLGTYSLHVKSYPPKHHFPPRVLKNRARSDGRKTRQDRVISDASATDTPPLLLAAAQALMREESANSQLPKTLSIFWFYKLFGTLHQTRCHMALVQILGHSVDHHKCRGRRVHGL